MDCPKSGLEIGLPPMLAIDSRGIFRNKIMKSDSNFQHPGFAQNSPTAIPAEFLAMFLNFTVLFSGIFFFLGCAVVSFLWTLSRKKNQGEIETRSNHV